MSLCSYPTHIISLSRSLSLSLYVYIYIYIYIYYSVSFTLSHFLHNSVRTARSLALSLSLSLSPFFTLSLSVSVSLCLCLSLPLYIYIFIYIYWHDLGLLLYGCTTWTLTKRLEKKLDGNYTRMLRAILNKSWRQHPTKHQLYGPLPPVTKTIQVRRTRHVGHCWRNRDKLLSDVLLWTLTYGRVKVGRPARTCIQQLYEDTGCSPKDLPEAMNDSEKWLEMVWDICAGSMAWWWWWYIYIYI